MRECTFDAHKDCPVFNESLEETCGKLEGRGKGGTIHETTRKCAPVCTYDPNWAWLCVYNACSHDPVHFKMSA